MLLVFTTCRTLQGTQAIPSSKEGSCSVPLTGWNPAKNGNVFVNHCLHLLGRVMTDYNAVAKAHANRNFFMDCHIESRASNNGRAE